MQFRPEDIEPMVYERFPVTEEEKDCRQIRLLAEKARAAYRQKLALQYKQQYESTEEIAIRTTECPPDETVGG